MAYRTHLFIIAVSSFLLISQLSHAWMPFGPLTQKRLNLLAGKPGEDDGAGISDGVGSSARFTTPTGVTTVDSGGNIYVLDGHVIRKITSSGSVSTFAGTSGGNGGANDGTIKAARFKTPLGITISTAGNIYVSDTSNHTIRKITPAGIVTTFAGTAGSSGTTDGTGAAARFNTPYGIAVDSSENLYVADKGNRTIRKITSAGVTTTLAGTAGSSGSTDGTGAAARFNTPYGVGIDSGGNIYVADGNSNTIRKITSAGVVTTFAGTAGSSGTTDGTGAAARFNVPIGLAVDSSDNIWVADAFNYAVRKITSARVVSTFAGTGGNGGMLDGTGASARFKTLNGISVDSTGKLYVADVGNYLMRQITSSGVVTTIAGTTGRIGSVDGTGSSARFNLPNSIAIDSSGTIYVADTANHTIRKITSAGVVSTFAGSAGVTGSTDATGTAARFNTPKSLAVDSSNNIYVADTANHTIRKITSAGVVSTFAGSAGVTGSTDATGTAARFNTPNGVAADSSGNIYVADSTNHTIRKITSAGVVSTLAGSAGVTGSTDGTGAAARFSSPTNLAVDSGGNIFVSDTGNHTIRKMTSAAVVTTLAGTAGSNGPTDGTGAAAQFNFPNALAVDSSGNIYVADRLNYAIRKITSAGVVSTFVGTAGLSGTTDGTGSFARFNFPSGVAVDSSGDIYIADTSNAVIRKSTSAGVVTTFAGYQSIGKGIADGAASVARLNSPYGLAVDSSGNVFVADTYNHTIRKITSAGVASTLAGTAGLSGTIDGTGAAARLNFPIGVAIDSSNNIYVADSSNHTIRLITSAGVVTTFAGTAGLSGTTDGTGAAARFNSPYGVAVDSSGNVYVADTNNHSIRKITSAGVVTTMAGTAGSSGTTDGTGAAARFNSPYGVAVDSSGNVYVADTNNHSIRKITSAGVVTTMAGTAGVTGVADGIGTSASFNSPYSITVDNGGNLYIADTFNHTIRKVTSSGVVSTLVGVISPKVDIGALPAKLSRPSGIAYAKGRIYFSSQNVIMWAPIP